MSLFLGGRNIGVIPFLTGEFNLGRTNFSEWRSRIRDLALTGTLFRCQTTFAAYYNISSDSLSSGHNRHSRTAIAPRTADSSVISRTR